MLNSHNFNEIGLYAQLNLLFREFRASVAIIESFVLYFP